MGHKIDRSATRLDVWPQPRHQAVWGALHARVGCPSALAEPAVSRAQKQAMRLDMCTAQGLQLALAQACWPAWAGAWPAPTPLFFF